MINFTYLSKGLNALARAHLLGPMSGHLGASVIAGYFVGEQHPDLDDTVINGIENDLERVIRGDSVFGASNKKNAPINDPELFAPFAKEVPDENRIDDIADALRPTLNKPRASGHNVIFAALAIRALKDHPEYATPSIIDGICALMHLFQNAHPGSGYYGKAKGRIQGHKIKLPDTDDAFPPYNNVVDMAEAVIDEHIAQDLITRRQGYGGLEHVNNHAAAIIDLARYQYDELIPAALKSHHQHFRLWKNLPDISSELGPKNPAVNHPLRAAYWTSEDLHYNGAVLTHRVKTMYGFDELADTIEDAHRRKKASENLRFLM